MGSDLAQLAEPIECLPNGRLADSAVLVVVDRRGDRRYVPGEPSLIVSEHPEPDVRLALAGVESEEQVGV